MIDAKVSVVIPCYNVERYVAQCLDSVVNQTLRELEIICVNDGSTDSTLAILQEYADKDTRVKIIDKPNGGYGESMNRGFDAASGEYLGIIESDDYAEPNMFEKLYRTAKENTLDVVKSGFYFYYSKNGEVNVPCPISMFSANGGVFCPIKDFHSKTEMVAFFNHKPSIWSAIYRRDFIRENGIRFHETPGASFQDASFNFKVWACAKRVILLEDCFVHYRQDNEASSINSPGKLYCVCDEYDEMARFLAMRPVMRGILEPVMVRIQYDSYMWNYDRLAEPLQKEFLLRFQNDFKKYMANGLVLKEYYEDFRLRNILQIIKNPMRFHVLQKLQAKGKLPSGFDIGSSASKDMKRRAVLEQSGRRKNLVLRVVYCLQDNGLMYTIRRAAYKAVWMVVK